MTSMTLTIDQPIESLPPITGAEIEEIMQIMESITEADAEELQLMKQLMVAGCGDYREPQCMTCRYFEKGEPSACMIAWDGEDEDRVCEEVEISLFMLAEKQECPYYTVKERNKSHLTIVSGDPNVISVADSLDILPTGHNPLLYLEGGE